jgi:hypothetical protein
MLGSFCRRLSKSSIKDGAAAHTIDSDKDGIGGNDAATDSITAADFSPISEERHTSIMSNMSIRANTSENSEISHSSHKKKDLTNSSDNTTDQLTKCQEKSIPIPQNSEQETTPTENLGESEGQKVRNESEEELTKSKDYPAYIGSQEKIFSIHSDKDITAISSNVSESNHGPKLAPYVSRLYPSSDLFKCEYWSVKQDRWGMAEHSHSEKSKKREK